MKQLEKPVWKDLSMSYTGRLEFYSKVLMDEWANDNTLDLLSPDLEVASEYAIVNGDVFCKVDGSNKVLKVELVNYFGEVELVYTKIECPETKVGLVKWQHNLDYLKPLVGNYFTLKQAKLMSELVVSVSESSGSSVEMLPVFVDVFGRIAYK